MKRFMTTKMAMSVLVITVALAMVGMGTFAAWSDTENSTGNSFTAGSLDLQLSNDNSTWTDGVTSTFVVGNVAPNDTGTDGVLYVKNAGTINASSLAVSVQSLVDADNSCPEPEKAVEDGGCLTAGELSPHVYITIKDSGGNTLINNQQLSSMPSGSVTKAIAAGGTDWLQLSYAIDNAGNDIMTDSSTYTVKVVLNQ